MKLLSSLPQKNKKEKEKSTKILLLLLTLFNKTSPTNFQILHVQQSSRRQEQHEKHRPPIIEDRLPFNESLKLLTTAVEHKIIKAFRNRSLN